MQPYPTRRGPGRHAFRPRLAAILLALALVPAPPLFAGGAITTISITNQPSPVAGELVADIVPSRWPDGCTSPDFYVNDAFDPIPNPIGPDTLTVAQVIDTLEQAAAVWNDIPTSYSEIRIAGTTTNPNRPRFDQIHEITFRRSGDFGVTIPRTLIDLDFGAFAYLRSTTLLVGFNLPDGLDADGDGDSDVSAATDVCADTDGDGDFEYPAGFIPAGSVLDTDLVFDAGIDDPAQGVRFTAGTAPDTDPRSVDLMAIAVQEFGLAQGVAHSLVNQYSATDGLGSPMFHRVDTADPAVQVSMRSLDDDARATASWLYPEGSAASGPGALQPGDVAFEDAYGRIEGEIRFGTRDEPMAGGAVFAQDVTTGRIVGTAISGTTVYSVLPNGSNATFLDADYHVLDGHYTLIVPPGTYRVGVEPVDGTPSAHSRVNLNTFLQDFIDQDDFHEDWWNGPEEGLIESRPWQARPVTVAAGEVRTGIDIVTNLTVDVEGFGSLDSLGTAGAGAGGYLAVRFPAADFVQADTEAGGDAILHGAEILTGIERTSNVPVFARAILATGTVHPDGTATVDLADPLLEESPFVGQDYDFTPWYFRGAAGIANEIRQGIADGSITDLFVVVQLPAGGELPYIGLDGGPANDVPIAGDSFVSADGALFTPSSDWNFLMRLVLSERP